MLILAVTLPELFFRRSSTTHTRRKLAPLDVGSHSNHAQAIVLTATVYY